MTDPEIQSFLAWVAREGWAPIPENSANAQKLSETLFEPSEANMKNCAWPSCSNNNEELWVQKRDAVSYLFYGTGRRTSIQRVQQPILLSYVDWCTAQNVHYGLYPPTKAVAFIQHRVAEARRSWQWRVQHQPRRAALHEAAAAHTAFQTSIPTLHRLANWQGWPLHLYSEEGLRVLEARINQEYRASKTDMVDSAATSAFLTKRLNRDELDALFAGLWAGHDGRIQEAVYKTDRGRERAQMRGLVSAALLAHAGKRGADVRMTFLRMLFLHEFRDVGPAPCYAVGISLRSNKTDDLVHDNEHLMGFIRCKDRRSCPVGALAVYLVWENRRSGFLRVMLHSLREELAYLRAHGVVAARQHFMNQPPAWYYIALLPGGYSDSIEMSSSTHRKDTLASLANASIANKDKVTHLFRYSTLGTLLEGGVSTNDAAVYQQWSIGVLSNTYARGCFNILAMLKAHYWDADVSRYYCWWQGPLGPLGPLAAAVFPELDEVYAVAKALWEEHSFDRSAIEVCKVLSYLANAFLEDAVVLRSEYPEFPAYRGALSFERPEWAEFAKEEPNRVQERERLWRITQESPEVFGPLLDQWKEMQSAMKEMQNTIKAGSNADAASAGAQTELIPWDKVPEIPDPHPKSLHITYGHWAECRPGRASVRSYFAENKRPSWSKSFPIDKVVTMKQRYHRLMPFFKYVDACVEAGHRPRDILDTLQQLCVRFKVDGCAFIKQCFYHLAYPPCKDGKRPPPVEPGALRDAIAAVGLPAFDAVV